MIASLRDLKVWQEAVALGAEVVRAGRRSARRETKAVSDEVMTTALRVATAIAEGTGHHDPQGQHTSYRAARLALLRLETELAISRQAGLLDEETVAALTRRAGAVGKLLGGYLVYLERQLGEQG
jgi:four helix bundle protein